MSLIRYFLKSRLAVILILALLVLLAACAPTTPPAPPVVVPTAALTPLDVAIAEGSPTIYYRAPTYGEITPSPKRYVGDLSTTIEVPPFPYSGQLSPAEPSVLDGLYAKKVLSNETPTPCRRCAGYRIEGGVDHLF